MTTSELALLDSNILIYAHQALSKLHPESRALISEGFRGGARLCVCPQVLNEFYAVITDPRRVTNSVTSQVATREVEKYVLAKEIWKILPGGNVLEVSLDLMRKYAVKQQDIFDLHLVATMLSNGLSRLYTFNGKDFSKFREIEVLTP